MKAIYYIVDTSGLLFVSVTSWSQTAPSIGTDQETVERLQVVASRKGAYTEITEDTQKLVALPSSFGDPIGAITALPSVIMPSGGSEPAVRGPSPEDNRYYIDGLPAGYIFHEFTSRFGVR